MYLHVGDEEFLQAFQCPLSTECSKEFHECLRVNGMGVDHSTLDVLQVSVVLQEENMEHIS